MNGEGDPVSDVCWRKLGREGSGAQDDAQARKESNGAGVLMKVCHEEAGAFLFSLLGWVVRRVGR